jgi:hypothetical protein
MKVNGSLGEIIFQLARTHHGNVHERRVITITSESVSANHKVSPENLTDDR